jgi:hypothetical protein
MSDSYIDNRACPGRVETIQLWLDSELPASERAVFEAHLATCHQCQADLAALETIHSDLATLTEVAAPGDLVDQVMANLPVQATPQAIPSETNGRPFFLGQLALAVQIGVGLVLLLMALRLITPDLNHPALWLPWLTVAEMFTSFGAWLAGLSGYVDLWARKWPPTMEFTGLDISPTLAVMLLAGLGLAWLAGNTLLLAPRQSPPKNGGV